MAPRFTSVLVSITERCHVGCAHCGFIGSTRDREPDVDEMTDWVEQVCQYGIPMVIFTGGEPFERFDCLVRGVAAARNAGTPAALFTSSVWGSPFGLTHRYIRVGHHRGRAPFSWQIREPCTQPRRNIVMALTIKDALRLAQKDSRFAAELVSRPESLKAQFNLTDAQIQQLKNLATAAKQTQTSGGLGQPADYH
jgi:organic radical activating enzyme